MKVANSGPLRSPTIRRKGAARGLGSGEFAAGLTAGSPVQAPSSAAPIDALTGLLAVQEVSDDREKHRRARARGELILSRLEDLRLGLLSGAIPRGKLNELLTTVRGSREQVSDPRLREILDEIELRAAVEVAKLEQSG